MNHPYYLDQFKNALSLLDKPIFEQKHLELKVGIWLDSVVLKIQKKAWLNSSPTAKQFEESVFFSV